MQIIWISHLTWLQQLSSASILTISQIFFTLSNIHGSIVKEVSHVANPSTYFDCSKDSRLFSDPDQARRC